MGSLTPGATYVYEKSNGITYAREIGSVQRKIIGIDEDVSKILSSMKEDILWQDIRKASENHPALKKALDKAILIYHLSKEDNNGS